MSGCSFCEFDEAVAVECEEVGGFNFECLRTLNLAVLILPERKDPAALRLPGPAARLR